MPDLTGNILCHQPSRTPPDTAGHCRRPSRSGPGRHLPRPHLPCRRGDGSPVISRPRPVYVHPGPGHPADHPHEPPVRAPNHRARHQPGIGPPAPVEELQLSAVGGHVRRVDSARNREHARLSRLPMLLLPPSAPMSEEEVATWQVAWDAVMSEPQPLRWLPSMTASPYTYRFVDQWKAGLDLAGPFERRYVPPGIDDPVDLPTYTLTVSSPKEIR